MIKPLMSMLATAAESLAITARAHAEWQPPAPSNDSSTCDFDSWSRLRCKGTVW